MSLHRPKQSSYCPCCYTLGRWVSFRDGCVVWFPFLIQDTEKGSKVKCSHQPPLHGLHMVIIYIVLIFHSCKRRSYKTGDSPPTSLSQPCVTNTRRELLRPYSHKGTIEGCVERKVQAFLKYEALHRQNGATKGPLQKILPKQFLLQMF